MTEIIKNDIPLNFNGCDSVVQFGEDRKNTAIKILQITDMQFISSDQMRTPDRLRIDEINGWREKNYDIQCGNHIRSLIAQSKPDLIFITGDIVYGEFDDSGRGFEWFCNFMDSFQIPWAPVYGNHDNESKVGVKWQNQKFENCKYCLFKTGNVSGNGNYTVGIATGDKLVKVLYMADSNGCGLATDELVVKRAGIYPDQIEYFKNKAVEIEKSQGNKVSGFMAFHIPTTDFKRVEIAKGYRVEETDYFTLGVDKEPKDGDFGFKLEKYGAFEVEGFVDFLKESAIDGVFVGHCHSICTCMTYNGIKWVFGLKTGQYDYHIAGNTGGTVIRLENGESEVYHIPSLVKHAPYPGGARMFNDYFAKADEIE